MTDTVRLGPLEFERDGSGVQINCVHFVPGTTELDGETVAYIESVSREDWLAFTVAAAALTRAAVPPNARLQAFLFRIMRDNLPTGVVEEQVRVVERAHAPDEEISFVGCKALGAYAAELAERLVG